MAVRSGRQSGGDLRATRPARWFSTCASRLARAAATALVQAARTGAAPVAAQPPRAAVAGAYRAGDAELEQLLGGSAAAVATGSQAAPRGGEASVGDLYDLASSPPPAQDTMNLPPVLRQFKRKPKSRWPIFAGVAAAIAIVVTGIVGVWFAHE